MEPQKRCISYWDNPQERCGNMCSRGSFCDSHLFHYKYYSKYKNMDVTRPKSFSRESLILLQNEIDARTSFREKAIALECRDKGHDLFIGRLISEKQQIEEYLCSFELFEHNSDTEKESTGSVESNIKVVETAIPTVKPLKKISKSIDYADLLDKRDFYLKSVYFEMVERCKSLGWSEEEVIGLGAIFWQTKRCGTLSIYPYTSDITGLERRLCLIQHGMMVIGCKFISNGATKEIRVTHPPDNFLRNYKLLAYWFTCSSEMLWTHQYLNKYSNLRFLWKVIPENFPPLTVIVLTIKNNILEVEIKSLPKLPSPPSLLEIYKQRHQYFSSGNVTESYPLKQLKHDFAGFVFHVWTQRVDAISKILDLGIRTKLLEPDLKIILKLQKFVRG